MGSLENRISRLEGRMQPSQEGPAEQWKRQAIIAELKHLHERYGTAQEMAERAQREAEAGFPQRLRALRELEEDLGKTLR